jgi:hypothetical protein
MCPDVPAEIHLACDSVIRDLFACRSATSVPDDHAPTLLLLQTPGNIFPPEPSFDSRIIQKYNPHVHS